MASTQSLGWETPFGAILHGPGDDFFDDSASDHVVAFHIQGATTVEWRRGTRFSRVQSNPGSLLIAPAGLGHSLRVLSPSEWLRCAICPGRLHSIAEDAFERDGATVELVESYNRDAELWNLGQRLADQLRAPTPGSRLYAETLFTQIAITLLWNYSSRSRPTQAPNEALADPRLRRVIDYLHGALGDEVSLEGLAEIAGLSPNYFLHAFKQSTGRTPHRYLTELRIARACALLKNPHRSIVDISLEVGFSSQSHLTTVFRRFMKTTPAAYRDEVLGLNPCHPRTKVSPSDGEAAGNPSDRKNRESGTVIF